MSKYLYENGTDSDLIVVGVGLVKVGEQIKSDHIIEAPGLTPVKNKRSKESDNQLEEEEGDAARRA
ncbi:hypothetical protein AB0H71_28875 [Nocardia sp. NPDC050697]|uniref:hypothetical protein n=1 Tax=Nocardia sp. NPDC050697 TaxID=3155158 RepID=UPI0033E33174